jgi:2-polyprenyl-3-methyl-5-hydroxy-6-metoxy-1,4-benzoquinol methylase
LRSESIRTPDRSRLVIAQGRPLEVAGLAELDGLYDIILMNHTLPHIHDPVAFLTSAAAV